MKPTIVHVTAGHSFMGFVESVFNEVQPGANVFVGVGVDPDSLSLPSHSRAEFVPHGPSGIDRVRSLVSSSTISVFHNVTNPLVPALAEAPASTLRVWSGWGGDYYGSEWDGTAGLLSRGTRRIVRRGRKRDYWLNAMLVAREMAPLRRRAARAADVFSAPVQGDFSVFRKRFPQFRGVYSQLNYVSVEDTIALGPGEFDGHDILLGNSATPENNHVDVLEQLARCDLGGASVVIPLNYGYPEYADVVARRGRSLLGDQCVPLMTPLPLDDYHAVVARCSTVIMGHRRQQGLGNVLRALWQGAQVVLDPRNPVKHYLDAQGAHVVDISELATSRVLATPLREEEREINRQVVRDGWSRDTVLRNTRRLVDLARA